MAQGDFKAAKPLLETLVETTPLNGRALLALARTHAGLGDSVRASILFEHATQIPASAHAACLELANLELRLQHYERCLSFAEKALAMERSSAVEQFIAHIRTLIDPKS